MTYISASMLASFSSISIDLMDASFQVLLPTFISLVTIFPSSQGCQTTFLFFELYLVMILRARFFTLGALESSRALQES